MKSINRIRKNLCYQYEGLPEQENRALQGDGEKNRNALFYDYRGVENAFIYGGSDQNQIQSLQQIRHKTGSAGEGQQVTGGAFNLEVACYFVYYRDVVYFYTAQKNEIRKKLQLNSI